MYTEKPRTLEDLKGAETNEIEQIIEEAMGRVGGKFLKTVSQTCVREII